MTSSSGTTAARPGERGYPPRRCTTGHEACAAPADDWLSPPRRLICGEAGQIDDLAHRRIHRHHLHGPLHSHQERPDGRSTASSGAEVEVMCAERSPSGITSTLASAVSRQNGYKAQTRRHVRAHLRRGVEVHFALIQSAIGIADRCVGRLYRIADIFCCATAAPRARLMPEMTCRRRGTDGDLGQLLRIGLEVHQRIGDEEWSCRACREPVSVRTPAHPPVRSRG